MSLQQVDCIVVGAGVIGLAVARALSMQGRDVIVLEATGLIGSETSSRNSEVIHAGIYYPQNSLKARLCVAGKQTLYDFCHSHGVSHHRVGKILVATDDSQLPTLEEYRRKGLANGVDDLSFLSAGEVKQLEPELHCVAGLWSPSTGIINAHEYMAALLGDAEEHGAMVAFNSPYLYAEVTGKGFKVAVGGDDPITLSCNTLVNAAGLHASKVAARLAGLAHTHVLPTYYAKGNYFQLTRACPFKHLVYPMPSGGGLGVHVSFDLGGRCRFGPDIHWVESIDYCSNPERAEMFYDAIRRYWPGLPANGLAADYTGIRPKLGRPGDPAADFVIQTRNEHGIEGLVNLFGIESPGLTSSLAIAERVSGAV